jgi:hypothetical protein
MLFAFTANRSVSIAGLVLAPFVVRILRPWRLSGHTATKQQTVLNSVVIVAAVTVPSLVPLAGGLDQSMFAVDALRAVEPGRLFHDDAVGGYLIYSEWPERLVYIDDRAELYEERFIEFVTTRGGGDGWENVFSEFGINQALLKVEDPLAGLLRLAGWKERFREGGLVVLARNAEGG